MALPKGVSGNPNGRPKSEDTAAAAIRMVMKKSDWKEAAKALLSVLCVLDEKGRPTGQPNLLTDGKEKAAAYSALADRAYGKPVQKQIIQAEISPPIDNAQLETLRKQIIDAETNTDTQGTA